jgi:hypothetical protein
LIPSFLPIDFGVDAPASALPRGETEMVEALGDEAAPGKNGNTDEGFVVPVVGVDGAELDMCKEDKS